jgi:hypothetical protein
MGWWTTEDGKLIGDGPLDVAQELLMKLAAQYRADHGRLPTLSELLECLKLALAAEADSLVGDQPKPLITELSARTKKRAPARRPGDVFAVPLGPRDYAIGILTPQSGIADFFRVRRKRPRWDPKLKVSETFRLGSTLPVGPFVRGAWPVIAHEDYPLEGFELTLFRGGNRVYCGTEVRNGFVEIGSADRPGTPEEIERVPPFSIDNEPMVVHLLKERLAGLEPT